MSMQEIRPGEWLVPHERQVSERMPRRTFSEARERLRNVASGEGLAKGLGVFSIALGLAELAAPRQVARLIGVREDNDYCNTLRACGVREIASGVGLLTQGSPRGWLWARVGGDLMDLALLSAAARAPGAQRERLAGAAVAVAGVTLLDILASGGQAGQGAGDRRYGEGRMRHFGRDRSSRGRGAEPGKLSDHGIHVKKSITIQRSPEELYRYWRSLENLPRIMRHLETVDVTGGTTSHWKAKAAGMSLEWDAEIVKDEPNSIIAWRSLPSSELTNGGSVRFKPVPGDRGTEVTVELYYQPPGGIVGRAIAGMFSMLPEVEITNDLRAFKQVMELGELVHSDASIHRGMHPARPQEKPFPRATPQAPRMPRTSSAPRNGGLS